MAQHSGSTKKKRHVDELTPEEYSYLFDKALSSTGCEQWKNFRGDDDWELTCIGSYGI